MKYFHNMIYKKKATKILVAFFEFYSLLNLKFSSVTIFKIYNFLLSKVSPLSSR